ncbi:hypothetical protein LTR78_009355 [Recurvomyces mirabilis]|uniref:DUF6606 domain-containing protein n=1 Tax=Recurvomyces mirabilis TaxID=574656 RepID=A0AAE0TNM4_9PEZI|nr:hypothetical protein LTR78_009355 [Recurvomyces mirabilis]
MYSPVQMRSIINHVFLPPQLPQEQDECDVHLIEVTLDGLRRYQSLSPDRMQALDDCIGAIERLLTINSLAEAGTSEDALRFILGGLSEGQYFAVKVHAQNAAILTSRTKKQFVFETFELSPRNQYILEDRDTTGPSLVSELLIGGILRGEKTVGKARVSDMCVANGLNYRHYDTVTGRFFDQIDFSEATALDCTYLLPHSAQTIQRFLFRSSQSPDGPAPTEVIASQDQCPERMLLEEFRELSSLPPGQRIQWVNIMLQLAMPRIDFNRSETALVISQCINQAGPPGGTFQRESHADFQDESSTAKILDQVEVAFDSMKHSWKTAQAVSVLIGIATRVSALNRVELIAPWSSWQLYVPLWLNGLMRSWIERGITRMSPRRLIWSTTT